ncbi:serine hydrolase [Brevundimonas sp.]|uniref:serine hydrolase domain-containing protein n=1 Tax=Brevundimonas sp. TaxID=1871086 RepID=UPI001A2A6D25|nr:serine hydrolase domain-containing protein [Brevundimonas sp.]MBJ7485334.1 beta-lactamase family protein [Brevundimonas sp.]
MAFSSLGSPSRLPAMVTGLLLCLASPCVAQSPEIGLSSPRLAGVDAVIGGASGFAGVVGVEREGKVVHLAAYGVAERETGTPHRIDEIWRWSSVSKMITAILILQQVDDGRIALDSPLRAYLPDFAVNADRITIRQLLKHTSGLANANAGPDVAPADGTPDAYQQATDWRPACQAPPSAEPGAGFAYNNCDYFVLAEVLEAVTGQTYDQLIQMRIVQPLGLGSVGVPQGPARREAYVDGQPEPIQYPASWGAAAGVYGSTRDLLAIQTALMEGRLISAASRAEMWAGDPQAGFAALSVWSYEPDLKACLGKTRLVERYGEVGGVQVRTFMLPDQDVAIAVYSNDGSTTFGEVWRGEGLSVDILRAAACLPSPAAS